jgi:hypothetical protein
LTQISLVGLVSSKKLSSIRRKAIRRGVWFKVLTLLERGIIDLTILCVKNIRSPVLALAVGRIICRILMALKSRFLRRADEIGYNVVERLGKSAVSGDIFKLRNGSMILGLSDF